MKKFTALLSAFMLTFTLFGCEDKNTVSDPPSPEELTTETVPETSEPVFRELKDEDFKTIDMNLNIVDDGCPVSLESADLSSLDFGEVLTPCKSEEYADQYLYQQHFDDPEQEEIYNAEKAEYLKTASSGTISNVICSGDIVYFVVNYDDLCSHHASALFSYDLSTGESKKVDERIGMEYNGCYNGLTIVGGKLFFMERLPEDDPNNYIYKEENFSYVKSKIFRLDPETGETDDFALIEDYSPEYMQDADGELYVSGWFYSEDGGTSFNELYDPDTGEKSETDYKTYTNRRWYWGDCGGEPVEIDGGYYNSADDEEPRPYVIKTKYYSIDTGRASLSGIFAWKDSLSIIADEGWGTTREYRLYTYDLNTMERTMIKFNGFSGSMCVFGDGFIDAVGTSTIEMGGYTRKTQIYYIMPQIGMAYRVEKINSGSVYDCGDRIFLISYRHDAPDEVDPGVVNANIDGKFHYFGVPMKNIPEKIYWVNSRQ